MSLAAKIKQSDTRLNQANLSKIKGVSVPSYDRSALTPGIVHIGLGNFHRAHQAWYLHRLFEKGLNHDWAIIGAGVRPHDRNMRARMKEQDYLTTLIELDPAGRSAEIIGSMIGYAPVEENNASLIAQMADPAIRIVSLTITEGGYFIDPASNGFDASHPDILHDARRPAEPRTAFGAMIAALKIRRKNGHGPFTALSCDNIHNNGKVLRQTITSLARLFDGELAQWIDSHCTFPNSMVDCIVPVTGQRELAAAREIGLDDKVVVTHERFRQWVIEDDFCLGRPDWDKVGATFSDKVADYEKMKIRILNGGHQIIAATAQLLGVDTIAGAMEHPQIHKLFLKVEQEEIIPNVESVQEFGAHEYLKLIEKRFANPFIVDTTRRVAFDGSSRQPGFILPSVFDNLSAGGAGGDARAVDGLALVSAIWARYCFGQREDGGIIKDNDPFWGELQARAIKAKDNPQEWLNNKLIYGDLANEARFSAPFVKWLGMIHKQGLAETLAQFLKA